MDWVASLHRILKPRTPCAQLEAEAVFRCSDADHVQLEENFDSTASSGTDGSHCRRTGGMVIESVLFLKSR